MLDHFIYLVFVFAFIYFSEILSWTGNEYFAVIVVCKFNSEHVTLMAQAT